MYSISVATPNTMSAVLARWTTSPFNRVSTTASVGSTDVSIHGPSGHDPSKPFARAHWSSVRWRSRSVTSFAHVKPRMNRDASSARTLRAEAADHDGELALVVRPIVLIGSNRIGSPGPITAVEGFRNSSGSSGTSIPNSAACAA